MYVHVSALLQKERKCYLYDFFCISSWAPNSLWKRQPQPYEDGMEQDDFINPLSIYALDDIVLCTTQGRIKLILAHLNLLHNA